jgi:GlpG protein
MRQLATLANAEQARLFADHLLTLRIETRLDPAPGGWAVWVCDEDRLDQARKELEEFTSNPNNPRYRNAPQLARTLRQEERREEQSAARQQIDLAQQWDRPLWQ